jgi:hypothetical protein
MNLQVPSRILAPFLAVTLGLFASCAAQDGHAVHKGGYPVQHARTVNASEVPSAILTALHNKFPGATVVWVGAFGTGTNVAYSIEFTQAGKSLAVGVDTFGDVGSAYEPRTGNSNR